MPTRWGLGPVFAYESLLGARRWQVYAARAFFVVVLLIGMAVVWLGTDQATGQPMGARATLKQLAQIGEGFFYALAGIQVSLVLLAGPAATAGSICVDRARGTLTHMLMTDLSDPEIILGKLAARLAPVFGLIMCGVPVAALTALLGGIEFGALAGAFAISMALAVIGCALALTVSVWVPKMHEVLTAVYAVFALWLIALPIWYSFSRAYGFWPAPHWFEMANPYVLVFAPYVKPGTVGVAEYALFVAAALVVSAALTLLSIARLRSVAAAEAGRPAKAVRRLLPDLRWILPTFAGPTLDGNPVLWREWHRNRPSRITRRLWVILIVTTWTLAAWGTYELITGGAGSRPGGLPMGMMFQLIFGLLLISSTAPTVLAEERVRGSLDVLLSTPVSSRSIVVAKWWGAFRPVIFLALMPLYVSVLMSATTEGYRFALPASMAKPIPVTTWDRVLAPTFCTLDYLASGAAIVSLGIVLATWVRQLGRAVVISVIAFFAIAIGWIVLAQFAYHRVMFSRLAADWHQKHPYVQLVLIAVSPMGGPIAPLDLLEQYAQAPRTEGWIGLGCIIVIKLAVAAGLLAVAIATFDRCMGRVPESRAPVRAKSQVVLEELEAGVAAT